MSTEKTFTAISVTVPTALLRMVNFLKTPEGFSKVPKGTHSALVTMLFIRWVEVQLKAEWLDIAQCMKQNPDRDLSEIREFFLKKAAQRGQL